jgi:hypothetical protein
MAIVLLCLYPLRVPGDPPAGDRTILSPAEIVLNERLAGADAMKLMALADQANRKDACRILGKVIKILAETKEAIPEQEAQKFAQTLQRAAHDFDDVQTAMGLLTAKTVSRQVFYRRYREQWIYEHPLRLTLVFDCLKGKDAYLLNVLARSAENL